MDITQQQIRDVFAAAGARGFLHAHEIGGDRRTVDVDADESVATASVIKILIAVAFARAVAAGDLDPAERVIVPSRYQVGGIGTAGCVDAVEMSLRDLAFFMLSMSDNAATDVVYDRVGKAAVDAVPADLGLDGTHMRHTMQDAHLAVVTELGLDGAHDIDAQLTAAPEARVRALHWIDPAYANCSTPRETGALLDAIWTDRAGPPAACAMVRELMSHQVTGHRLAAGFDADGIAVAGKTGTIPLVRNEAGVVTYPDGRRYVAAVFTRAESLTDRQPAIDAAIGRTARLAVDQLRTSAGLAP